MPDEPKLFVRADALLRDSFELARRVIASGFRPDLLLAVWRGGTPVGVAVHEYLAYRGFAVRPRVIRVRSYSGIDQRARPVVEEADALRGAVHAGDAVLVVDDIFDTGATFREIRQVLEAQNATVRVATVYWRSDRKDAGHVPEYYARETDRWVVFPHELTGLTPEDVRAKGEDLWPLLQ